MVSALWLHEQLKSLNFFDCPNYFFPVKLANIGLILLTLVASQVCLLIIHVILDQWGQTDPVFSFLPGAIMGLNIIKIK